MKITHITNFETWKKMGEHYDFDPYEQVDFSIDKGGGNSMDYEYIGDIPEKDAEEPIEKVAKFEAALSFIRSGRNE